MRNFITEQLAAAGRDLGGTLLPWLFLGAMSAAGAGFLIAAAWVVTAEKLGVVAAHAIIGVLLILPMTMWTIFRLSRRRTQVRLRLEADLARTRAETVEVAFTLGAALGERIARQQERRR